MIAEAIKTVLDSAAAQKGRESHLSIHDAIAQENLHYLYSDDAHEYELVHTESTKPAQTGSVSNVESFVALVLEETRRRGTTTEGKLEPHAGEFMTVTFDGSGATFSPDDRVRRDRFVYERALSPQWQKLVESLGKAMDHKAFLRALQGLRPSIKNYDELMRHFRKLHFSDRTSIASEPMLAAGRNSNEYNVEIELRSGAAAGGTTTTTALPSEIEFELQYARGSRETYPITVEIDLAAALIQNSDRKVLRFTLIAPEIATVVERAVDDEVEYFRTETAGVPRLLVLQDY